MPIPAPIRDVVKAARAVAQAHLELKKAAELEASPTVMRSLVKERNRALERLVQKVAAFETALVEARAQADRFKRTKAGKVFDWSGFFKTSMHFADLVRDAMDPSHSSRDFSKKVAEFVDGEVID